MDFTRPVEAIISGAQGQILGVLCRTSAELTLSAIGKLSGVSLAQASRILPGLVELGLVERREVPPASLFRFIEENVASRAIAALSRARQAVLDEFGRTADESLGARSVVVFGSFGRGEATAQSDIDVVVVRPADVGDDDDVWVDAIESWRQGARRLSGNRIEVIEVVESEVPRLLRSGQPMWSDVLAEGVLVAGTPLTDLMED
jgi:DNA-binding MarR family transcriptional regulator